MREIEIKLKVKDLKVLEDKLLSKGCKLSKPIFQDDVIYVCPKDNVFESNKEGLTVLRIRKENGKAIINLKKQKSSEMDNLEYETEVKEPDQAHQMFMALGWIPQIEVKKIRKKGKLGEYEVCLDQVERLGTFVELEKLTDENDDPEKVRKELFDALRPFGLSEKDEETKGYDTQIYQLDNK